MLANYNALNAAQCCLRSRLTMSSINLPLRMPCDSECNSLLKKVLKPTNHQNVKIRDLPLRVGLLELSSYTSKS